MAAEITNTVGRETVAIGSDFALAVEDAGNHGIRVMLGQTAHEINGIFFGADRCVAGSRTLEIKFCEQTATPTQR